MSFSIPAIKAFISKISTGITRNWNTYCQYTNSSLNGYGILLNGTDAYLAGVSFSGSLAVNFNQDIFNLITDYGATITYSISRAGPGTACKYTPNPLTGSVTIGMSDIVITPPGGCVDTIDISITLTIAGMPSSWWGDKCCTIGYCTYNGSTGWSTQATGLTLN